MKLGKQIYTHGHSAAVVRQHASRTLEKNAPYLKPFLKQGVRVLDVGCGPGSITKDFAKAVGSEGEVVGIDNSQYVVDLASDSYKKEFSNLKFEVADIYNLPYDDNSFDIVHAHQVLQHLNDPVQAIREMVRVSKPNGVLGVRDSDYASMQGYPISPGIELWRKTYMETCYKNGNEPRAGVFFNAWFKAAGVPLDQAEFSLHPMLYTNQLDEDARYNWGNDWTQRALTSDFAKLAVKFGIATEKDLEEISNAWAEFRDNKDSVWYYVHGQMLCQLDKKKILLTQQ